MSKRTERMSRSAAERINRKDTVIRQNNAELEELRSQYENLDICEEDKQVIDDYIACKDAKSIIPPIIGSLTASHIFRKMMMIAQVASVNPIYCV